MRTAQQARLNDRETASVSGAASGLRALTRHVAIVSVAATLVAAPFAPVLAQEAAPRPADPPAVTEPVSPPAAGPPDAAQAGEPARPADPASPPAPATGAPPVARDVAPALHSMSPWGMFLGADLVVKAVMIGLAFASLVTWTVFLAKLAEMGIANRRLRRALARLARCRTLGEAEGSFPPDRKDVASSLVAAAGAEARLSDGLGPNSGVRDRVATSFQEVIRAEGRRVRLGMGLLATIGSTSPFVGLFGTVWGIMNSFVGIAKAQTTNLAVVAPGIAEALLATAIGLVAAIPAVIVYNHFSRVTRDYLELANRAGGTVGRLLSRDLDRERERSYPRLAAE